MPFSSDSELWRRRSSPVSRLRCVEDGQAGWTVGQRLDDLVGAGGRVAWVTYCSRSPVYSA